MRDVGVVWLGHADYLCENTFAVQAAARSLLLSVPGVFAPDSTIASNDLDAVSSVRRITEQENCCGCILVLTTWVECSVVMSAIKELRGRPCMLWGFPLEEAGGRRESTGSYVSASMFSGVVRRLNLPIPVLLASWMDPQTRSSLAAFTNAASAADALFYAKIGLIGYTSMSIYTGTFDHVLMRSQIGPEVEHADTYTLISRAEQAGQDEIDAALRHLQAAAQLRPDASEEMLRKTMALYAAMRHMCTDGRWDAINVKCQYELSKQYRVVPCVALSLLAEDGITASCEGDMLCTVSMLMLHYLSGQTAWYGDALTHWDNTVQFSPCGFLPFSMAFGTAYVQKFMEHPGFSGIQVSGVLRPERITWMRLVEGIGTYSILYGTGTGLQTQPRGGCMPALNVELDGDVAVLCREYAGQHYAIVYGDHTQEIEMLAKLLRLELRRV